MGRRRGLAVLLLAAATVVLVAGPRPAAQGQVVATARGLRVDGRPFLPVGIYYAPVEKLPQMRDMGFNVAHVWALPGDHTTTLLDQAHRLGMRVAVELADAYRGSKPFLPTVREHVRAFRSHPAVLAWYLYDEPEPQQLDRVQQGYRLVRELDPDHPVVTVHVTPEAGARFAPYTDIFSVDPYPVPNLALSRVWHLVARARVVAGPQKPVWAVIQAFAQSGPRRPARYPTPAELRNMVYQAIIGGATGILYFSYAWEGILEERDPALFAAIGAVNHELRALAPVILEGADTESVQVHAVGEVRSLAREWGGRTYVLVANMGTSRAQVELFRPRGPGPDIAVESLFGAPPAETSGSQVADALEPYGVRVYRW